MKSKSDADVVRYFEHFRSEHKKLSEVKDRLHQKLLAVTMLSALSEGRYPEVASSGKKFVRLIECNSNWPHATSVSISMLELAIKTDSARGLEGAFVQRVISCHDDWCKLHNPSQTVDLADDPKPADILPSSSTAREIKFVNSMKHSSLLHLYRCKLVHEFREPGHPFEFGDDYEPVYRHKELVYPTRWLLDLVPPILSRLEDHYLTTNTDPFAAYRFGSPWS